MDELKPGDRVEVTYIRTPIGGADPNDVVPFTPAVYRGTIKDMDAYTFYVVVDGTTYVTSFSPNRVRPLPLLERLSEV